MNQESAHKPTMAELEQIFADEQPASNVRPLRDEGFVPPHLRPAQPPTFEVHVDSDLPTIILAKALATQGLSIKNWEGKLVLTNKPEKFS